MKKKPVVLGTGFITMDIVVSDQADVPPGIFAGGTCGNVLAILGFLGWESFPLARLNGDSAANCVMNDLRKWNVNLKYIDLKPTTSTPIIVQEIKKNRLGQVYHKFSWTCPHCGAWLPPYRAVRISSIEEVESALPMPEVFFFDRVSPAALRLARISAAKGAIVYFEPSGVSNPKQFREALSVAHIVKYAHDRADNFKELVASACPPVEIETLGSKGLRYRSTLNDIRAKDWREIPSFQTQVVDAAGAGDWCTAGIIQDLGQLGAQGLMNLSGDDLVRALSAGQAMAAWTCGFEGARGGMYESDAASLKRFVKTALKNKKINPTTSKEIPIRRPHRRFECPSCEIHS